LTKNPGALLTGALFAKDKLQCGISVDQVAARHFEGKTSLDPSEFSRQLVARTNGTPVVSLHATATSATPHWRQKARPGTPHAATARGARDVWWDSAGPTRTPIYDRESLAPGVTIEGPAIVEAPDTTYAVCPSWRLVVNDLAFYVMTRK